MNWAVLAGGSAVAYALWAVFLQAGIRRFGWSPVLLGAASAEMLVILAITLGSLGPAVSIQSLGFGVVAGLFSAVGYLLFVASLSGTPSSLPVVVMSMYPALVMVIGALALHQALTWDRWAGVALAMVAMWLIVR